ncbi:hypothetical protein V8F33_002204 [Rhypophila sp. PSN 637]
MVQAEMHHRLSKERPLYPVLGIHKSCGPLLLPRSRLRYQPDRVVDAFPGVPSRRHMSSGQLLPRMDLVDGAAFSHIALDFKPELELKKAVDFYEDSTTPFETVDLSDGLYSPWENAIFPIWYHQLAWFELDYGYWNHTPEGQGERRRVGNQGDDSAPTTTIWFIDYGMTWKDRNESDLPERGDHEGLVFFAMDKKYTAVWSDTHDVDELSRWNHVMYPGKPVGPAVVSGIRTPQERVPASSVDFVKELKKCLEYHHKEQIRQRLVDSMTHGIRFCRPAGQPFLQAVVFCVFACELL